MKIIDLLVKISKGEEVPKEFISNGHSYTIVEYSIAGHKIINYKDEDGDYLFGCEYELGLILNQEIIEEEEKEIEKFDTNKFHDIDELVYKINDLIDVINEMRIRNE